MNGISKHEKSLLKSKKSKYLKTDKLLFRELVYGSEKELLAQLHQNLGKSSPKKSDSAKKKILNVQGTVYVTITHPNINYVPKKNFHKLYGMAFSPSAGFQGLFYSEAGENQLVRSGLKNHRTVGT